MQSLYFKTAYEWENWLAENHDKESELKLIYYKKHTGIPCVGYDDSVKIALCFGWIDSLVNRIDDQRFSRKFSKRKPNSVWSESNKKRVEKLIKEGKMKTAGMHLVEIAKKNGKWNEVIAPPKINTETSAEFEVALASNPRAKTFFSTLTQSQKKQFKLWINMAKRTETRRKRISESLKLLKEGKKLGLK